MIPWSRFHNNPFLPSCVLSLTHDSRPRLHRIGRIFVLCGLWLPHCLHFVFYYSDKCDAEYHVALNVWANNQYRLSRCSMFTCCHFYDPIKYSAWRATLRLATCWLHVDQCASGNWIHLLGVVVA